MDRTETSEYIIIKKQQAPGHRKLWADVGGARRRAVWLLAFGQQSRRGHVHLRCSVCELAAR